MNINDVDCIGQFVAGDPICPQPRPEQTRLMTHSSPSGGRPACRVMTSQFVIFITVSRSVICPDISISRNIKYTPFTLYTALGERRIIKLKEEEF